MSDPIPVPDRQELLELAGKAARKGSVTAIKLLLEEQRRADDDDQPGTTGIGELYAEDELAQRRKSA